MKSAVKQMAMVGVMTLVAAAAFANNPKYERSSISNLPSAGYVSVSGTVQSLDGNNRVTLRDQNGSTVNVMLSRNDYNDMKVGAPLTARGTVLTTNSGRTINAVGDAGAGVNNKASTGDGTGKRWE